MRFRDKVRGPRQPVVIYEIIPPRQESAEELNVYAERLSSLLSRTHVDAINIPEVRDETTRGARPVKALPKTEPRVFGAVIQQALGIEAIANRCVVYTNRANQQDWLLKTFKDYRIENLVLVGGESSKLRYLGPIEKGKRGIEFFTSQVIYEADEMIQDLSKLYRSFCIQGALLHERSVVMPKRHLPQI